VPSPGCRRGARCRRDERAVGRRGPLADGRSRSRSTLGVGVRFTTVCSPGGDVDVDHRRRRGERLVDDAERRRVPLGLGPSVDVVVVARPTRSTTGSAIDRPLLAVAGEDAQARLRVAHSWTTRCPANGSTAVIRRPGSWGPARSIRRVVERRGHDAEVDGVEVGEDHEPVAPVVDLVLDALDPLAHHDRIGRRVVRRDQPLLDSSACWTC
jgi:hypothetical protein